YSTIGKLISTMNEMRFGKFGKEKRFHPTFHHPYGIISIIMIPVKIPNRLGCRSSPNGKTSDKLWKKTIYPSNKYTSVTAVNTRLNNSSTGQICTISSNLISL